MSQWQITKAMAFITLLQKRYDCVSDREAHLNINESYTNLDRLSVRLWLTHTWSITILIVWDSKRDDYRVGGITNPTLTEAMDLARGSAKEIATHCR